MAKQLKPYVVSTEHRGVFFGYGEEGDVAESGVMRLERVRMAVYWPAEVRGVLGLAATGPLDGSRIGPAAPAITLRGVTAVMEPTEEAVKRWEAEPWK